MWHDPYREDVFLEKNTFLPLYNGLTADEEGNARRRANFLRLDRAVFMGGFFGNDTGDGNVKPSATMLFGFWKPGGREEYAPMQEQEVYRRDTFGLRTLHETGRLELVAAPFIRHADWFWKEDVAKRYVIPHLT
eukprot:CAMPEP_0117594190 /NCGR_PEP_ID=MMETSP0784-20121206/73058_1 /TAXON_ID=39447 /ORGANISM="" /LENGTH=133 /DNA_ID=CAMNT_0005396211 /DNA_START=53 /DNA_END=454 /DNA_ORIENTATION=-